MTNVDQLLTDVQAERPNCLVEENDCAPGPIFSINVVNETKYSNCPAGRVMPVTVKVRTHLRAEPVRSCS